MVRNGSRRITSTSIIRLLYDTEKTEKEETLRHLPGSHPYS